MSKGKRKGPGFRSRPKPNPFLAGVSLAVDEQLTRNTNKSIQVALDQAILTLHDEFGFGETRAARFREAFKRDLLKWAEGVQEDAKFDKETIYTSEVRERELKKVLGKNYEPPEVRYSGLGHPKFRGW